MARRLFVSIVLASCATANAAIPASPAPTAFVACPVLRDTNSVGCWLAEYQGELYYLGISEDQAAAFDPPSLGHKALVEGVITSKARVCGGIPVEPVHVSVLEPDPTCNKMIPSDPNYQLPFKAPRGPGPREKRQGGGPPGAAPAAAQPPQAPFQSREFVVTYDFDNERAGASTRAMVQAMTYAGQINARQVEIVAYRGAVKLADGSTLAEKPWIAERRAHTLADTLAEIGIKAPIKLKWEDKAAPAKGGGNDAASRRATIRVLP